MVVQKFMQAAKNNGIVNSKQETLSIGKNRGSQYLDIEMLMFSEDSQKRKDEYEEKMRVLLSRN